jgi:hypothetical protein
MCCAKIALSLASNTFRKENLCSRWEGLVGLMEQIPSNMHGGDNASTR